MNIKKVSTIYFSPTGGTEKIARLVAGYIADKLNLEQKFYAFTKPENRQQEYYFNKEDLLVVASPVYAGRLPNKLMPEYKAQIWGEGTPVVPVCIFGNRSPGESLQELMMLLADNGFQIVGAAAFAGRHAFSDKVGYGRPDEADLAEIEKFAAGIAEKLLNIENPFLEIDRGEIGPYYTPLKEDGEPARFLRARPRTDAEKCTHCGLCVQACPLGSIDRETAEAVGLCIKCQACIHCCPVHAKYFEDRDFLSHVAMLEKNYTRRAENHIIL